MLIGILSDTHGQHGIVQQALAFFGALGVEFMVHCGDVGGIPVLDPFVGHSCRFVWGNMDSVSAGVRDYLEAVGLPAPPVEPPLRLELDGKHLWVFHGHERGFRQALQTGRVDFLLHGHTHQARDERVGRLRVINPGALHRARPQSIATLDTATDVVSFYAYEDRSGMFVPWAPQR